MLSSHILTKAHIKSLKVGSKLFISEYFKDNKINEGELITFDYILSEDNEPYLLEINTDLALTDLMVYGSGGFDFNRLKEHIDVKGYEKVCLVIREEHKGFNPQPQFISKLTTELPQCQVIFRKSRQKFKQQDDTYYIKNIPTTEHGLGLITISRYKNLFRDWLKTTNEYHYMPECKYDDSDYREQYIKPRTDEYGNPIVMKCLYLLDNIGLIPLRPESSQYGYSEMINLKGNPTYVDKNPKLDNMFEMEFENSTFNRSGVWAQVGGDTLIEGKPIRDLKIGDKVRVSNIVKGHHYPTPADPFELNKVNDDTIVDMNNPWVSYRSEEHQDSTTYSTINNIHKYDFDTWIEINNFMFSPIEFIYINRDNMFQFIKTTEVRVGDSLLDNPITNVEIHNERQTFYGLEVEGYDNYYLDSTIITTLHHLPKP